MPLPLGIPSIASEPRRSIAALAFLLPLLAPSACLPAGRVDPGQDAAPQAGPEPTPPPGAAPVPAPPPGLARQPSPEPEIAVRLLPWDDRRTELTKEYRRVHCGEADPGIAIEPRVIVLHWTGGGTIDSTWNTFAPSDIAGRADLLAASALNVSAHFVVGRDGAIVRLLPDDRFARHVIGLNHVAIGIENVGGREAPLTEAQVEADAALVRYLAGLHQIEYLIGHLEYREMEGTPLFCEKDPSYRNRKPDPGADFMAAVRARVADLGLAGPPR